MIRRAQRDDIPAVQAVARVAWEHTYKDIMRPATRSCFLDEFYSHSALSRALELSPGGLWVAQQAGEIVGFIQVVPMLDGSGLELTRLYVLPTHQRKGIGQKLLDRVKSDYPDTSWWALVERDDTQAVVFYEKQGFERRRSLTLNLFGEDLDFVEFCQEKR